MKKNILLSFAILLIGISHAQIRVISFEDFPIKGHVKQLTEYNFDKVDSANVDTANAGKKDVTFFDAVGNRIKKIGDYKQFGTLSFFNYENTDSTITEREYNDKGELGNTRVYTYNKKGQEISFAANPPGNQFTVAAFYDIYDNLGNRIEEDQVYKNKIVQKVTFLYNDKGQEIEKDDSKTQYYPATKYISEYDATGNMVKQIVSNVDGTDINEDDISYASIDKNGNWLRRELVSSKWHKKYITIRVIEYY